MVLPAGVGWVSGKALRRCDGEPSKVHQPRATTGRRDGSYLLANGAHVHSGVMPSFLLHFSRCWKVM